MCDENSHTTNIYKMKIKCLEGWLCTKNKKRNGFCVLLLLPGPRLFELCCLQENELLRGELKLRSDARQTHQGRDSCLLRLPALLLLEDLVSLGLQFASELLFLPHRTQGVRFQSVCA